QVVYSPLRASNREHRAFPPLAMWPLGSERSNLQAPDHWPRLTLDSPLRPWAAELGEWLHPERAAEPACPLYLPLLQAPSIFLAWVLWNSSRLADPRFAFAPFFWLGRAGQPYARALQVPRSPLPPKLVLLE